MKIRYFILSLSIGLVWYSLHAADSIHTEGWHAITSSKEEWMPPLLARPYNVINVEEARAPWRIWFAECISATNGDGNKRQSCIRLHTEVIRYIERISHQPTEIPDSSLPDISEPTIMPFPNPLPDSTPIEMPDISQPSDSKPVILPMPEPNVQAPVEGFIFPDSRGMNRRELQRVRRNCLREAGRDNRKEARCEEWFRNARSVLNRGEE